MGATEMATSPIDVIFTVPRDHLDEGPTNTNELQWVCFPKALKTKGCHEDGGQLDSLHFTKPRGHLDGGGKTRSNKRL